VGSEMVNSNGQSYLFLPFMLLECSSFYVPGFLGQDTGVSKLDEVTQVYVVLSHGLFV
jgi:hypothetical protein